MYCNEIFINFKKNLKKSVATLYVAQQTKLFFFARLDAPQIERLYLL